MNKSISCIIPLYGVLKDENWLRFELLIESIYKATINLSREQFELILVNDEPEISDKLRRSVKELLHKYEYNLPFFYVSNSSNSGQGVSRNIGASIARMNYLHFIDQDDFISPNFFECFFKSPNFFDVYLAPAQFYIEPTNIVKAAGTLLLDSYYRSVTRFQSLWLLLFSNIAYSPGQILLMKDVFNKNKGFNVLSNYGSDDYGLFYRLVFYNKLSFSYMDSSIFFYRIHAKQNSRNCSMSKSVSEFISSIHPTNFKEMIICRLKVSKYMYPLTKLLYVSFFRRVVL